MANVFKRNRKDRKTSDLNWWIRFRDPDGNGLMLYQDLGGAS